MPIFELQRSKNSREGESLEFTSRLLLQESEQEFITEWDTAKERLVWAAEWALELDAHFRVLIQDEKIPRIIVPTRIGGNVRRVRKETPLGYQMLRRGTGELIRPVLLTQPRLKELYPFQLAGVEWLESKNGAILADDMGLGKTVQVISAMRLMFNRSMIRTCVVVCPKGLLATWEREFNHWAPELCVAVLTPSARLREIAWKSVLGHCHVILTNYEQLREPPTAIRKASPNLLVADEAHRLRNRAAKITTGCRQLMPDRFWALSGTPLERDIEDLITLLTLVAPNRFSPRDIELHSSSLRSRARNHLLRRRKEEVLEQLPSVLDTTEVLELSVPQERAYRKEIKRYRKSGAPGDELALLTRLQALCDIDSDSQSSSKVERILNLLKRIRDQGEKAVVFSLRLKPLRVLESRISELWGKTACPLLIGDMQDNDRNDAIEHFRTSEDAVVLLASTRIASEGLTLVEANHVFLFNQWWNPSSNDQARDRVVRIGQRRKVRIYRFCCRGTIEEILEQILDRKKTLFNETVERLAQGDRKALQQVLSTVGVDGLLKGAPTG